MSLQFPLIIEFEYWEITNLINRQTLAEQVFNGFWTELILTRSQSLVNSSGWLTGRGREQTDPIGRWLCGLGRSQKNWPSHLNEVGRKKSGLSPTHFPNFSLIRAVDWKEADLIGIRRARQWLSAGRKAAWRSGGSSPVSRLTCIRRIWARATASGRNGLQSWMAFAGVVPPAMDSSDWR